jgi:DNA-binding beta-propeller fold protein YncE
MYPWKRAAVVALTLVSTTMFGAEQADPAPINDLPNPYKTTRDWARPPGGAPWAAVTAVEAAPDGSIYVIHRCAENSCAGRPEPPILKFDPSGKLIRSWGEGMFVFPHGATVDPQGNLWVTDAQIQNGKGHQVFKFNADGKLLLTLGKAGVASADPGLFDEPTDVVIAPNGDVFVTEGHSGGTRGNDRVSKFSRDGKFIKAWGRKGAGADDLDSPHTIAIDSRGRLFVGDRGNNRIQIFDQEGKRLDTWRQFARPSGIAITADDTIYVADSESWGPDQPGWKKGIRVGSARDGSVRYFIEDSESTVIDHSGAEGVGVDRNGNVYGAVVRRRMLEKHTPGGVATSPRANLRAPRFEVDPLWPKPLPNHWVLGSTVGVSVDAQDHVWIIHRPESVEDNFKAAAVTPPVGICCTPAPPVLEFDAAGNLVRSWGGPGTGYEWPESNHGITVDFKNNVWIGANGMTDAHILKFTREGKFLLQIGHRGKTGGSNNTENLGRAAKIVVDPVSNEAYVADGYGNRRVIVFDADTGKYKRHWGAYGAKPDDAMDAGPYDPAAPPARQFRTAHCANVSKDGFVYVCDRVNNRIQVFRKDGAFVKEASIAPKTLRSGSVWDMAFSRDDAETYLYVVDGVNERIYVLLRSSLEIITTFGDGGRQPGQFFGVHNIATDSKGNLYTTETYTGARLQRFLYKGVAAVQPEQGPPWPR